MSEVLPYQDPQRPIDERVQDLLDRMTLEEKVGQMWQMPSYGEADKWISENHVGSFLHSMGQKTNKLQKLAEETRLGIPLIFGIDAIHGHAFWHQSTVFPSQLALSCSWNPDLIERVGRITAKEVAATGVHWTFSPVLGTARDLRWGRIDETFGEDPYLIGVLGQAIVRGYQGDDLSDPDTILACGKHYAGYPYTQGGRDASEADITRRQMLAIFLKPFQVAVEAGCATLMSAYQAVDGTPCTASRWLLWDVLRDEWGFEGFVVTDWDNIGRMHTEQMVSPTMEDATRRAVEAGNDMMMSHIYFPENAIALVRDGQLDEALIDEAARRVLRLKFKLGLFDENRYADLDKGARIIGCEEHRQAALEAACESIVLLKNENSILPLKKDVAVAVIGPNADDVGAQLGDWTTYSHHLGEWQKLPAEKVVTVLGGIRNRAGDGCRVDYAKGCDVLKPDTGQIAEAVELAGGADVAVVVIGDVIDQNGEAKDRANLDLSGGQQALLEAVHATGTPMVVVLINGRPLSIPWVVEHADAIVEAWNPGMEGGTAVASILFGDVNPSGKLTISFPYHVGQQPVYYNQSPGWHGSPPSYIDMPVEPLYPFGYGLSYTTFAYSNLEVLTDKIASGRPVRIEVDVENTGKRAGVEIVQLYINDVYSSVTTPVKELKAFRRVELAPGERQTVQFEIPYVQLALVNADLETVVEPGTFEVMVGSSSRDKDLLKNTFEVG
jgi:beta-glucosidase